MVLIDFVLYGELFVEGYNNVIFVHSLFTIIDLPLFNWFT